MATEAGLERRKETHPTREKKKGTAKGGNSEMVRQGPLSHSCQTEIQCCCIQHNSVSLCKHKLLPTTCCPIIAPPEASSSADLIDQAVNSICYCGDDSTDKSTLKDMFTMLMKVLDNLEKSKYRSINTDTNL